MSKPCPTCVKPAELKPRRSKPRKHQCDRCVGLESRLGRCYELSLQHVLHNNNEAVLVHGTLTGKDRHVDHAWTEYDGNVYDPVSGLELPQAGYYQLFNAVAEVRYEFDDMCEIMARTGHYGPWHKS